MRLAVLVLRQRDGEVGQCCFDSVHAAMEGRTLVEETILMLIADRVDLARYTYAAFLHAYFSWRFGCVVSDICLGSDKKLFSFFLDEGVSEWLMTALKST